MLTARVRRARRHAHARGDPPGRSERSASTRHRRARCSARCARRRRHETTPVPPAQPVRRRQGVRPLHHRELPRELRPLRLLGDPVQPRVAAARPRVRHAQGHGRRGAHQARARPTSCASAISTPSATGASPATTSRRCGSCCSRTRPTTTWSPPARATRCASSCELAFAHVGPRLAEVRLRRSEPAAPGRGRYTDRRPDQGAREARVETEGQFRGAGPHDGRCGSRATSLRGRQMSGGPDEE